MAETTPDELHSNEARFAAQRKELGTYVATAPIECAPGVLAYDRGHPVPVSNIDSDGRVILARHVCTPQRLELCDEATWDVSRQQCAKFNEPIYRSEPGLVGRRAGVADDPAGIDRSKADAKRVSKPASRGIEE